MIEVVEVNFSGVNGHSGLVIEVIREKFLTSEVEERRGEVLSVAKHFEVKDVEDLISGEVEAVVFVDGEGGIAVIRADELWSGDGVTFRAV